MAGRGSSMRLLALAALLAGQAWSLRTYGKDNASVSLLEGPWKPWELRQRNVGEKHGIDERTKTELIDIAPRPTAGSLIAFIEAHPDYEGLALKGTVQVRNHNYDGLSVHGIAIQGVVTGLEEEGKGTFYIYEGFSCRDNQNPMEGFNETWSADDNGVASIFGKVPGWSLWGSRSVVGRALVLHDEKGVKIGCGMLELTSGEVSHISQFPGHTGYEAVQGTIVTKETSDGILLTGTLGGLPPLTTAGIRIHSGYSCSAGPAVGAHYTEGLSKSHWSTSTYTSDFQGSAQVSLLVEGFSLYYDTPVMGRVIVVNGKGPQIGCGVIGKAETLVASFGTFPGYIGAPISGTVAVTASREGLQVQGVLTGLPHSLETTMTLHSGFDCTYTMTTGEASEHGTASFKTDMDGAGTINKKWAGFSISDANPLAGRVLVISDSEGVNNIGCATLKVTTGLVTQLGNYPGTGKSKVTVKGTLITTELRSGVQLEGTVAGLPPSSAGSYQIHEGSSCAGAAAVGAPHASTSKTQLSALTTTYESDSKGNAQILETVGGVSLYDRMSVMGRTIVFQEDEHRLACGVVGRVDNLVAEVDASSHSENPALSGTVHAMDVLGGIRIRAVFVGMGIRTSGTLRIHSGFSCSSGNLGDAYANLTAFKSDSAGSAAVDMDLRGFTLAGAQAVAGRAVVLYSGREEQPVGCGLLQVTPGHVTHIGAHPGSESTQKVSGVIVTEETETGITMRGTLSGLPPSTSAGFHVASGYSCVDEKAIGGKYYARTVADPWTSTLVSDDHGALSFLLSVKDFSLFSEAPVLAHAVVLEGPAGGLACGAAAPAAMRQLVPVAAAPVAAAAVERSAHQQRKAAAAGGASAGSGSGSGSASPSPWLSILGFSIFGSSLAWSSFMSYVWMTQHPGWKEHTMLDPDEWVGVDGKIKWPLPGVV